MVLAYADCHPMRDQGMASKVMDEDEFIFTMEDDDLEVEFFPEPELTETVH